MSENISSSEEPIYPDSVYKCIKRYSGYTKAGKSFVLDEGNAYSKTQVNLKEHGGSDKEVFYLHNWGDRKTASTAIPYLEVDEFKNLDGVYIRKEQDLPK